MTRPIYRLNDLLPVLNRGRFVEKCDDHLRKTIEHLEALPEQQGKATVLPIYEGAPEIKA